MTSAQKQTAERLLAAGNTLFLEYRYVEALAKYRKALESWDHPAIRFNIARALINLERPVEAYENIQLALRYGRMPLLGVYNEARNYELLLRGQIATVTVICSQSDVNVVVDGNQCLLCPGTRTIHVLPGQHKVFAEKNGFLAFSRDLTLLPATSESVPIRLLTLEEASITRRRWEVWKPWAVTGSGAAVAGIGLLLELQARATRAVYADDLGRLCSDMQCTASELPDSVRGAWSRAKIEHAIGVSTLVTGSAITVAGLTLVLLNRPRRFLPKQPRPAGPIDTQVMPTVSVRSAGVTIVHRF